MSAPWAVAAVTLTLRNLLQREIPLRDTVLGDLTVTTRSPDMARKTLTGTSLNIFLYDTAVNAAWANQQPLPRPGESAAPQLALTLHYLLSAYGRDDVDQDALNHRVLGAAMAILHENPVLTAADLGAAVADSRVAEQVEQIKVSALPMGVDELSKLWTACQSNLRVGAAYEVSVVLIDGAEAVPVPLPVLTRGSEDRGVQTVLGAAPVLAGAFPQRSQPAARQGESIVLQGSRLSVAGTLLRFRSLSPSGPSAAIDLMPQPGPQAGDLALTLPDTPADPGAWGHWRPGFYSISAVTTQAGAAPLHSNAVALALAPAITVKPHSPATVTAGGIVTLTCSPRIGDGQQVLVLCGDAVLTPATILNPAPGDPALDSTPTTVTFTVPVLAAGSYPVRLRVDGVDSIPVDFTAAAAAFDPAQQVQLP